MVKKNCLTPGNTDVKSRRYFRDDGSARGNLNEEDGQRCSFGANKTNILHPVLLVSQCDKLPAGNDNSLHDLPQRCIKRRIPKYIKTQGLMNRC